MHDLPYSVHDAIRHLSSADPVIGALIHAIGPYQDGIRPAPSPFEALCEAIAYQQLSGKAAATIYGRFRKLVDPNLALNPVEVLALPDEMLRGAGLSGAKTRAIKDLALHTVQGTVPLQSELEGLPDEEIIERLTIVNGVGPWSVKMYLMFRLGRPDVLPQTDLGIRKGVQRSYGLSVLPAPKEVITRAEPWRPFRTLASWYLWRSLEMENPLNLPSPA
ncbi:MAG: DNA-3-methyladenine glycosylase [Bacteroidetes bacterium]|nr:DNA-3-methyladenine glycosylase [Bacteroidota bacterium]